MAPLDFTRAAAKFARGGYSPVRGRKPIPTVLKIARGNPGKRPLNHDEPQMERPESLRAPSGLKGAGLREWQDQAQQLADRGVLTDADLTAFEDYCRALTELRNYEAKAKKVGLELAIAKGFT